MSRSDRQTERAERDAILVRLAQSRAEIRDVLDPPVDEHGDSSSTAGGIPGSFPRSRTMQMLMSGRGLGAVGAVVGGLFIARPALVWRLIRLVPAGAVARIFIARAISALRAKQP
ncbi:MAG TPA: hypothetical protein VMQ54_14720 [Steroidobacteraceae bacterium]|jgi:hypothetical protein|nr:hypothetical protein [Steroidobacteraceae bacterium]